MEELFLTSSFSFSHTLSTISFSFSIFLCRSLYLYLARICLVRIRVLNFDQELSQNRQIPPPFTSTLQKKKVLMNKVNPLLYSPKELFNSRVNNSSRYGPIRLIIKLIRDLMVISILTKFDADLIKSVDARE